MKGKRAQSAITKALLQMIAKKGNILWVSSYGPKIDEILDRTCLMGIEAASSKDKH